MASDEDLPNTDDINEFWAKVHQIKGPGSNESTYENLLVLVRVLLVLQASNADGECCFPMVRKIDSEDRSHLERSTVSALLTFKVNVDGHCYYFKPSDELLQCNKSAVRRDNEVHGSYTSQGTF